MNSNPHRPNVSESVAVSGEETLRLLAGAPAPSGLEERVHAALRNAPRSARVLAWPRALRADSNWMRSAAAAAIVFVVAGGGWGVYTRVVQNQPAKVIVMPLRMPVVGGFQGAGAMRTPQTLPGATVPPASMANPARPGNVKKPVARTKIAGAGSAQPAAAR